MARDQYQTVTDVAARLKESEVTVRSWVRQGEFRAIDTGKGWRIADQDLNAYLRRHATHVRASSMHNDAVDEVGGEAGCVTHE